MKRLMVLLACAGCGEKASKVEVPNMCDVVKVDSNYFIISVESTDCDTAKQYKVVRPINKGYIVRYDGSEYGI